MKIKRKTPSKAPAWGLRDYYERRDRVLVVRDVGGLGDILMQRMMFESFKRVMPECHITWAVPQQYLEAAARHPFVDEVVDCRTVNKADFTLVYNITFACGRYENAIAPRADKHRSDIWANHCGVVIGKHEMYLGVTAEEKKAARQLLQRSVSSPNAPILAMCPASAQIGKDMSPALQTEVVTRVWQKGCNVVCLHNKSMPHLDQIGCRTLSGLNTRQWITALDAADYVLSVDTSAFHCAGGLKKPLVGIFTYCDGKVYGKYFDFVLVQKHRDDSNWDCGPCFNWSMCKKECKKTIKPCASEITSDMVMDGIEKMMAKWPYKPQIE